jgi:chemotaxis protein methyltransferase CheR
MNDMECVRFLQWALPKLHMRWTGFRRVRGQVCKRLQRRLEQLQLDNLITYCEFLNRHDNEWETLDGLCQITISRFYRDKMVFAFLKQEVFPHLIKLITEHQETELRIWSVGCGAGEEPYTLALLWALHFQPHFPTIKANILGTDINPAMLERATKACYPYSAVKNLPPEWRQIAFKQKGEDFYLYPEHKAMVEFQCEDVRQASTEHLQRLPIHLICCRNLAFTYFDEALQNDIAARLYAELADGGVLMIGVHEALPAGVGGFYPWNSRLGIYRKR